MKHIVFCDSVIDHKTVDADFASEYDAATKAGFFTMLISFEALVKNDEATALRSVKTLPEEEKAIYRGWMLTKEQYGMLYEGLLRKNIRLINDVQQYQHCHYFPNAYKHIAHLTPRSVWIDKDKVYDHEHIAAETEVFGNLPIIVKDHVRSEKHRWEEACFIPNAADKGHLIKVVDRFLELSGTLLNGGLVFRQFESLEFLANHTKSGMPLTKEFRLFFLNGQLVDFARYWDEGIYSEELPPFPVFSEIAQKIESNFFSMDVAKRTAGDWIVMELGDGQTAGLPETIEKNDFFKLLMRKL